MLQLAIAGLPRTYREILLLRDVEELNIRETAARLGVREGAVKTRLLRARLMMRKVVCRQGVHRFNAPSKREKNRPAHPDYYELGCARSSNGRARAHYRQTDLTAKSGQPLPYWQDIHQQVAQM